MRSLVCGVVLAFALGALAQEPSPSPDPGGGRTRQLWDETFLKGRAQAAQPARKEPARAHPPKHESAAAPVKSSVGITLWRLQAEDPALAYRVQVGADFSEGQKVRLSVESPAEGYLYVVDREQYADGSLGDAYLIFPTLRVRAGNNAVTAGRVVELPDAADRPPYFTLRRSRADHVGEVLTMIITPSRLPDLEIGRRPLMLAREQIQKWEKEWKAPARQLELPGGAFRPYTPAERDVGQSPTRLLTQDDPLPQTIFEVEARPGTPLLVAVPLRMKAGPGR